MVLAKSLRIWLAIGLVFGGTGCILISSVPTPETRIPSLAVPTPTTPPVLNTATAKAAVQLIPGQLLIGSRDEVESLAFRPDGKVLAALYKNGKIVLWDVDTRQSIQSFPGGGEVNGLGIMPGFVFSPDGKFLVSKANGSTPVLWDVATGQSIEVESGLSRSDGMALSPDGKLLAYGKCAELDSWSHCSRYEIILWDVATRQPLSQPLLFDVRAPAPLGLLFSPDGKTLAVMSSGTTGSGEIRLYDVDTRQPIVSPLGGEVQFSSLAFRPDGKSMALGSIGGVIHIWDVKSHTVFSHVKAENGLVTNMIFSPDGRTLAARILIPSTESVPHEKVVLWDMDSLQPVGQPLTGQAATGNEVGLISIAFSPDGRILASGTEDGVIVLWDLAADSQTP